MPHLVLIVFLFVLGSVVGSFLNVVVYRLPLDLSLVSPGSRCPQCETPLAWYDNIPVFGWIFLRGKCRYCRKPISARYPIIEAITGFIFASYYILFFMAHAGPSLSLRLVAPGEYFVGSFTNIIDDWPIYGLDMALLSGLLAASLIDAELFIIPASIPWWIAGVAMLTHAIIDAPSLPGSLLISPGWMALSAGAAMGLVISIVLLQLKILPLSFAEGDLLEVEREALEKAAADAKAKGEAEPEIPDVLSPSQIRAEMRKEMLFLGAPIFFACLSLLLYWNIPTIGKVWIGAAHLQWLSGLLGSMLGAMVGGFIVWMTRIAGSYFFGREAMGLGDVHLMFGVGAVLGAGAAAAVFLVAPFFGIAVAIYLFLTGTRRQLPYGPYLSLATAFVMLFYSPIAAYLWPGMQGLMFLVRQAMGMALIGIAMIAVVVGIAARMLMVGR